MATTTAGRVAIRAREPLWTRNYILTLASMHLFFVAWALLFSTLPLYLEDARKWQIGWVVAGAFGVASLSVRMWSGRLTDRLGRRAIMVWGAVVTAAFLAAHALTDSPLLLTPIRLAFGVGMCFYTTAAMAMLADVLPLTRRGEGMGWYGVIYTASNVYGPWLGLAIAEAIGLRPFFVVAGGVVLACAAVSWYIVEADRPIAMRPPGKLISRSALLPTYAFMSLAVAFSVLPAFLVLYARQRDLGSSGAFFVILGLALVAARWFGGTAADRFGRNAAIIPGFALSGAGMALLAFASGPATFYLAAAMFGFGFGFGHTGLTILTIDRAPAEERGAAMATFVLAWDIGTLGAFALGFVADAINLRALFTLAAVLPIVTLAGFMANERLTQRRKVAKGERGNEEG